MRFFWVGHFGFFFSKKKKICLIPWKIVKGSWIARMGRNFDDNPGFQPFRSWANTYAQDCIKVILFDHFSNIKKLKLQIKLQHPCNFTPCCGLFLQRWNIPQIEKREWKLICNHLNIQVNDYKIVVNFFHVSHNLTWYSGIVHKFTRIYSVSSTYELTQQFM